jgi:hypothetical protein
MDLSTQASRAQLDNVILSSYPTPISILYKKMLQEDRYQLKAQTALELFEVWMRSITLQMLIQYLDQDIKLLHNDDADKLNEKLKAIYKPSLGDIVELFFSLLKAYQEHPESLFMKELYNIQWEAGTKKKVSRAREDFDTLIIIRNELAHGRSKPQSEEAWQGLYEEIEPLLLSVLSRFQFIKEYRIVYGLEAKPGKGAFLALLGLEPARIELEMGDTESIQVGRFYLDYCGEPGCFYELHPLFLPWPSDFLNWEKRENVSDSFKKHTAIYDSYIKNKIHFAVHTEYVKDLVLTDQEAIKRFLELFENTLKQIQPVRTVTKQLHWREFQRAAGEITYVETEAIREKFSKDLYLQREHIKAIFEHFLRSEKVAFVLLGQSGVGKSNFVMAMYETYRESSDIHMVVLNSARLIGEGKLVTSLTEMFVNKIALIDKTRQERKVEDIFEEINNIQGIENKKVVLAFDAINENPNPHQLLKRIDDLVSYNKYDWLKVMITSRPEAWQSMKRQYRLTESKYYRQTDTEEMEVELKGFDQQAVGGWLAMDRFKAVELPEVYGLYQEKYRLRTNFDELSAEMKVMLRDPLALRLVAEAYGSSDGLEGKDGILPHSVRTSKLYDEYVKSLINSGRLERSDTEIFLKQKLQPLMFDMGDYRNVLDSEILTETIDKATGKSLSEEIELVDILPSSRKQVNQAFQNLADAGILVKQGSDSNYEIRFNYERFYDYFGGEHLFSKNKKKNDREKEDAYKSLAEQIKKYPFLWGAVRNAIFQELILGTNGLIDSLAKETDQSIRELLISVLVELGNESGGAPTTEEIIKRLSKIGRDKTNPGKWLRIKLTGTDNSPLSPDALSASKTAIEVARQLNLITVLEKAAMDPFPVVRVAAVRNIYHIWRHDSEAGYDVLERMADLAAEGNGLPNIPALESSLALAILILRHYFPDTPEGKELGLRVARQMQKITRRLFFVSSGKGLWKQLVVPTTRNFIVNAVVRFVVQTQESYPKDKPAFLNEVGDLLRSPADVKARYDRLLNYFDNPSAISDIRDDLYKAAEYNDTLTNGLVWLLLIFEFMRNEEADYSILEELASLELRQPSVGSTNQGMIIALGLIASHKKDTSDETFQRLERMTVNYIERTKGFYFSRSGTKHPNLGINTYMSLRRMRQNPNDRDLPAMFIQNAIQKEEWTFCSMLLDSLATQVSASNDFLSARMALQSLKVVFPIPYQIEDKVIFTLAKIRLYCREEVDNFLIEIDAESKLLPKVLRVEPDEQVWSELFHNIYSTILVRLLQTPEIKDALVRILRGATQQKNLDEYLKSVAKDLMNLLTGEKIFQL